MSSNNTSASKKTRSFNIYDFDHTIYKGDCSLDFYYFSLARQPSLVRYFPAQCLHAALFLAGLEERTVFKSHFFAFLGGLKNPEQSVEKFWKKRGKNIKKWYTRTNYEQGIIISASPDFLIRPMLKRIGIPHLIATDIDINSGKIRGLNCRGEEKVRRFKSEYPASLVGEAYSDSKADTPILQLAKHGYIVKGEHLKPFTD